MEKHQCLYCKKKGNYKKDCPEYYKMICEKNYDNITSFVNESLYIDYAKYTWCIDSEATIHIANYLHGFGSMRTTQQSERKIKFANGVEAEVEAVGALRAQQWNIWDVT